MGLPFGPETDFVPEDAHRLAELRSYREFRRLVGRGVPQPAPGEAVPVVLVPGFISGNVSLTLLARRLRRAGHRTFGSEIGANLGCTDVMVQRLTTRLARVVEAEGRPVAVVGHSRGGMIVKLAAQRRPDLVSGIVVLAAPVTGSLSVAPHVRKQLELLFRLHGRGFTRVIGPDCVTGDCAERVVAELASPFPPGVAYTSVFSRTDAILDWQTCLDPQAEQVEVTCGHTAMSTDPDVAAVTVERLAALTRRAANRPVQSNGR